MNGPSLLPEDEFEAIQSVIAASERGRLFLFEYVSRRRAEEAARLLAAIDRFEVGAFKAEAERARQRMESDRAAEVVRQLAEVLKDLRPLADARLRARALQSPGADASGAASVLERRFAALVDLDERDLETGLKLFG